MARVRWCKPNPSLAYNGLDLDLGCFFLLMSIDLNGPNIRLSIYFPVFRISLLLCRRNIAYELLLLIKKKKEEEKEEEEEKEAENESFLFSQVERKWRRCLI